MGLQTTLLRYCSELTNGRLSTTFPLRLDLEKCKVLLTTRHPTVKRRRGVQAVEPKIKQEQMQCFEAEE